MYYPLRIFIQPDFKLKYNDMKAFYSLLILFFALNNYACQGQEKSAISETNQIVPHNEVVDFHSTHRVSTMQR